MVSGTGLALVHCCTREFASHLHVVCVGPSPASWHMVTTRGGGRRGRGHILYTPHGHTDSRSPGGGAGRVRSSTTKKGVSHGHSAGTRDDFLPVAAGQHEMWSVCIADVGRGQDLVPVWHLVRAVAILILSLSATFIFRHFMHTVLPAHLCSFVRPLTH